MTRLEEMMMLTGDTYSAIYDSAMTKMRAYPEGEIMTRFNTFGLTLNDPVLFLLLAYSMYDGCSLEGFVYDIIEKVRTVFGRGIDDDFIREKGIEYVDWALGSGEKDWCNDCLCFFDDDFGDMNCYTYQFLVTFECVQEDGHYWIQVRDEGSRPDIRRYLKPYSWNEIKGYMENYMVHGDRADGSDL